MLPHLKVNFFNIKRPVISVFNATRKFFKTCKAEKPISVLTNRSSQNHLYSVAKELFLLSKRYYMDLSTVTGILRKIAPLQLAEAWDNVGLLVEPSSPKPISTILFTNDLTMNVQNAALMLGAEMIFSYHPPIFAPLKSLRNNNWKEKIILKCIENGIAVYSPHTACDAVQGGVNDWLISCFELSSCVPVKHSLDSNIQYTHSVEFSVPSNYNPAIFQMPETQLIVISSNEICNFVKIMVNSSSLPKIVCLLSKENNVSAVSITKYESATLPNSGMGRYGKLYNPIKIQDAINCIKAHLHLEHIRISLGNDHKLDSLVSSVAVCAGSGSSVLRGVTAELYVTGEMSHHDLLDAAHNGVTVILCEHSNSERGFLFKLIKDLEPKLKGVRLMTSESDKDPVLIV